MKNNLIKIFACFCLLAAFVLSLTTFSADVSANNGTSYLGLQNADRYNKLSTKHNTPKVKHNVSKKKKQSIKKKVRKHRRSVNRKA